MSIERKYIMLETFNKHFEIVEATTPELRQDAYKLRYKVYCETLQYIETNSDEIESDEYDSRSIQYLIRHRRTNTFVAGGRLVLSDPANSLAPFPFEPGCLAAESIIEPVLLAHRNKMAEFGRVLVDRTFLSQDHISQEEKEAFPLLVTALYACALRECVAKGLEYICGCQERKMIRFLSRMGMENDILGPSYDDHGKMRFPVLCTVRRALDGVKLKSHRHWRLITSDGQYQPVNIISGEK